MASGPALETTFGQFVSVTFPNVGHYRVGKAMEDSGMLIAGGFQSADMNNAVLLLRSEVNPTDAVMLLMAIIEKLVGDGTLRVPTS